MQIVAHAAQGIADAAPVSSIAQACGYHAMGLFSIDFQQRFHVKPSVLLREARGTAD